MATFQLTLPGTWFALSEVAAWGWLESDVATPIIFGRAAGQGHMSQSVPMTGLVAALVQSVHISSWTPGLSSFYSYRYTYKYVHMYTGEQLYEEYKTGWDLGSKIHETESCCGNGYCATEIILMSERAH